ncbi:hypothetical protein [Massilia niastensis]|uniref:hypothetical protein n=1 Tax=Massilia niastensis TaxID=544911 RepID=UPI0003716857|nr:hypothetical protein [Massilia niastensis]
MFGSTVLEVAIGLAFCYGTLALVVSTIQEALAAMFGLRARMLLDGIKRMLGDPRFDALARSLYAHPLVNPQGSGSGHDGQAATPASRPSYIDPTHFAIALVDSIRLGQAALGPAIAAIPDPQLRRTLQALHARAGGDLQRFQDGIASWFDNGMERLSGVYKRRQLLVSWLVSLLLAILLNIDSIHLFRTLWQHPALAAQISAAPGALDAAALNQLWALPIGWASFPPGFDRQFALQAAGWLLTASTTLFGAPFWFDLLQRAVKLRGTGAKPASARPMAESRTQEMPGGDMPVWDDSASATTVREARLPAQS